MISIITFILIGTADARPKVDKTYSYNKVPKSLFLIKKAELQASDGEPSINFADKQKRTIMNDDRLVYKQ